MLIVLLVMSWMCESCSLHLALRVYCSFKTVHNALRCPSSSAMYLPAGVLKRGEGLFPQLNGETAKD